VQHIPFPGAAARADRIARARIARRGGKPRGRGLSLFREPQRWFARIRADPRRSQSQRAEVSDSVLPRQAPRGAGGRVGPVGQVRRVGQMRRIASGLVVCSLVIAVETASPAREVAVTIDDLPVAGVLTRGDAANRAITTKLLGALAANHVPAIGFVN